eukprot:COSAG02_NODE_22139_length_762_cov_0.956259_2_plen_59_part_01
MHVHNTEQGEAQVQLNTHSASLRDPVTKLEYARITPRERGPSVLVTPGIKLYARCQFTI